MEYVLNTNVLRTAVTCAEGRFDVYDYAPRIPAGLDVEAPIEIQRLIVPREGAARVRVLFDPKPDYAVDQHPKIVTIAEGLQIGDGASAIYLRTNAPLPYLESGQPIRIDEPFYFAVSYGKPSDTDSVASAQRVRDLTIAGWRAWAKSCALPSFASLPVLRSALCLKLHAYTDTGAIIAAATTSIPEAVGSERTWDYRYCWLRDAAFVVEALRRVGHLAEGEAFVSFLRDVAEAGPLQPLYGIGGERELVEEHLDHLDGYCGSKPVRIGNAAYLQRQHDLMGEMILCLDTITSDPRVVIDETEPILRMVERFVTDAMVAVETDDTGLWEYRTFPNKYTFSHVLCWVAASRGAKLVRRLGRAATRPRMGSVGRPLPRGHPRARVQRRARLLHAGARRPISRCVESAAADARPHRSARSAVHLHGRGLRAAARRRRARCCAIVTRMTSAIRRAPSRSARSGGPRRSPWSAASKMRAGCSSV